MKELGKLSLKTFFKFIIYVFINLSGLEEGKYGFCFLNNR